MASSPTCRAPQPPANKIRFTSRAIGGNALSDNAHLAFGCTPPALGKPSDVFDHEVPLKEIRARLGGTGYLGGQARLLAGAQRTRQGSARTIVQIHLPVRL